LSQKKKLASFVLYRGLCTILRSEAGGQDDILQDVVDDDDDGAFLKKTYSNNSHWLPEGQPKASNHVAYYDAASLYPSSGEIFFLNLKHIFFGTEGFKQNKKNGDFFLFPLPSPPQGGGEGRGIFFPRRRRHGRRRRGKGRVRFDKR